MADGRLRVWQHRRERFRDECVPKRGRGISDVMGGISWQCRVPPVIFHNNGVGRGTGVTGRYVDEVLQSVLVPFMEWFSSTTMPEPTFDAGILVS